jgi:hypothetical protein
MKITIEATDQITRFEGVDCRVWKGVTERGTKCILFVHRLRTDADVDPEEFRRELDEQLPPGRVVDLRFII